VEELQDKEKMLNKMEMTVAEPARGLRA